MEARHNGCFLFIMLVASSNGAEFSQGRLLSNKVSGVATSCSAERLKVTVRTTEDFTGAVYARGYPSECKAKGGGRTSTVLTISTEQCGVKIVQEEDGSHTFKMAIYVQYDPFVQQVSDEQVLITCSTDSARDLTLTGRSGINVTFENMSGDEPSSFVTRRNPKENKFSLSEYYPASILNLPSKLQQMVSSYYSQSSKTPGTTTAQSDLSSGKMNRADIIPTTSEPEPYSDNETENIQTLNTTVLNPTTKAQLPLQTHSAVISIKETESTAPSNIIVPANSHKKEKYEPSTTKLTSNWKPIPPPLGLPQHVDKWKSLLGDDGNDEMVSCWLDIVRGESPLGKAVKDEILVGETATLVVRVHQQPGISSRVTSCKAHDGSGVNAQQLIDENGCSVDEDIMPSLKFKTLDSSKEKLSYASFKAFKFPDHDSLHFRCTVEICLYHCKQVDCAKVRRRRSAGAGFFLINPLNNDDNERIFGQKVKTADKGKSSTQSVASSAERFTNLVSAVNKKSTTRIPVSKKTSTMTTKTELKPTATTSKTELKPRLKVTSVNKDFRQRSTPGFDAKQEIMDSVDVFNSVEVRAPSIEYKPKLIQEYQKDTAPSKQHSLSRLEEEEVFCVTSSKLLTAFGLLLAVLVGSILAALYWCVKDRNRRDRLRRNTIERSSQQLPRFSHLPPSRFHGVLDYQKFPHLDSPYHRFHHQ